MTRRAEENNEIIMAIISKIWKWENENNEKWKWKPENESESGNQAAIICWKKMKIRNNVKLKNRRNGNVNQPAWNVCRSMAI